MRAAERKALANVAEQARKLAADMRDFNARDGRPAPARFDIAQLARSVSASGNFNQATPWEQNAHVLEVALKTRIGLACLDGKSVEIDLGNGYVLECRVHKKSP
jgi:hypothetical protein